jgi:serine/threonine protein kinase
MEMEQQISTDSTLQKESPQLSDSNYEILLQTFGIHYKHVNYYIQVGEMNKQQGWILHLSSVLYQVTSLLQTVVPFLISEQVPFKIVNSLAIAEDLLAGNLGAAQIGKIVSIFPENDIRAVELAKILVNVTAPFKGPAVPTDLCLGNVVYTRFGSFNPVIRLNEKGGEEKYIYDLKGQLVPDLYSIPFQFPDGIIWPFYSLKEPTLPEPPRLFNRIYKIIDMLKTDCRGNVYQGLYLKSLLSVKKCALKQGFTNADSDCNGRDIRDKLSWQVELYRQLHDTIPMPELYDFIEEDAYSLLVMEYINGDSLYKKVYDLNPYSKAWQDLSPEERLVLINYGLELSGIISRIHQKGYLHRDIMPVNFLIDKRNRMFAIDLELAYSLLHKRPDPPFKLGTPGFASPEQMKIKQPKIDQDIYSLGATLLWLFTGLTPIKFLAEDSSALSENLNFFIQNRELALIMADCISAKPESRPAITAIISTLEIHQMGLKEVKNQKANLPTNRFTTQEVESTIYAALNGLNKPPVVSTNDYWYSRKSTTENRSARNNKQYTRYPGISEGMAGPLYLLARLQRAGINTSSCMTRFNKALDYIQQNYLSGLSELPSGLYHGVAGMAIAIKECILSGLINTDVSFYKASIQTCLGMPNTNLDLASGVAGQGIAILQCKSLLSPQDSQERLFRIVDQLLTTQQKNGVWHDPILFTMGQGDLGILWFLLEYLSFNTDRDIQSAVERGLNTILNSKKTLKSYYNLIGSRDSFELVDGATGVILLFIKAFEHLQDNRCKLIVQNALLKYPPHIVHPNFSQQNGLAGLGEVYLEACRVLGDDEWRQRADWITAFFLHTFCRNLDSSGYWILEENDSPTADLQVGISGIIHYLARVVRPDVIGYRLLK